MHVPGEMSLDYIAKGVGSIYSVLYIVMNLPRFYVS
jgi:hypothetical protein